MNGTGFGTSGTGAGGRVLLLLPSETETQHWSTKRLLRRAGLTAEQFSWASLEALRSDGANPRVGLQEQCRREHVSVVVPMGEDPLYELLGTSELLRWFHRAVQHSEFGVVVPNFTPSKLLPYRAEDADDFEEDDLAGGKRRRRKAKGLRHPPRFTGVAAATLHKALRIAREGLPPAPEVRYLLDPTPAQFRKWAQGYLEALAADPQLVLSRDCETAYHLRGQGDEDADLGISQDQRIIRMSFAYREDEGVTVPFEGAYVGIIAELLASPGPKLGWNCWSFDSVIEELNGLVLNGRDYDGQDAFHLLQSDLDKGLEFVSALYTRLMPWKHTASSTADLYAAIDAVAALQNFNGIKRDLIAAGQWDLYERHAVDLHPILRRASKRGVMIDQKLRGELREEFREKLLALLLEAQGMVPQANKRFHPYVRKPKDAVGEWEEIEVVAKRRLCLVCERPNVNRRHACKLMPEGWSPEKHLGHKDEVQTRHINVAPSVGASLEQVEKWLSKNGFNPNSSTQLLKYMEFYRHPKGRNHKTEEDSADNKHLKKLVKTYGAKHPIYPQTVQIHLVQKALSQYVEGIVPDAEGLVHTQYTNGPSTWRLASRAPNLQNISKSERSNLYAVKTRKMFVARPGHVFVQCDSTSVESVIVGYCMDDKDYIALAKRSLPAYLVAWKRGIVKTKAEYFDLFARDREQIMKLKKDPLYTPLKITNHGSAFGATPYLLHMSMGDIFPTLSLAKDAQKTFYSALPGLPKWQHQIRVRAQKEQKLRTNWGVLMYFYDVFTYQLDEDGKVIINPDTGLEKVKLGKDGNRAVASIPQSSNGSFQRDNIHIVGNGPWAPYMPATLTVHDSLKLEVPERLAEEAGYYLLETMTRKVPELDGLRIGAECEIGNDWLDMQHFAAWTTLEDERMAA